VRWPPMVMGSLVLVGSHWNRRSALAWLRILAWATLTGPLGSLLLAGAGLTSFNLGWEMREALSSGREVSFVLIGVKNCERWLGNLGGRKVVIDVVGDDTMLGLGLARHILPGAINWWFRSPSLEILSWFLGVEPWLLRSCLLALFFSFVIVFEIHEDGGLRLEGGLLSNEWIYFIYTVGSTFCGYFIKAHPSVFEVAEEESPIILRMDQWTDTM